MLAGSLVTQRWCASRLLGQALLLPHGQCTVQWQMYVCVVTIVWILMCQFLLQPVHLFVYTSVKVCIVDITFSYEDDQRCHLVWVCATHS